MLLGGGVFYQEEIKASLNKNPTPWGFSRHSPVLDEFNVFPRLTPPAYDPF